MGETLEEVADVVSWVLQVGPVAGDVMRFFTASRSGRWSFLFISCLLSCDPARLSEERAPLEVEVWRLTEEPDFRLAAFEVDGDSVFFGPIAPKAAFLESGEIVANAYQDARIVFLDTAGATLAHFGRAGQGPGEYTRIQALSVNGNTTTVWDVGNQRISVFSGTQMEGEFPLRLQLIPLQLEGRMESGELVATAVVIPIEELWLGSPEDEIQEGDPRPFHLIAVPGERVATLHGPAEPPVHYVGMRIVSTGRRAGSAYLPPQCAPHSLRAVVGNGLVIADAAEGRLLEVGRDGRTRTIFESPHRSTVPDSYVAHLETMVRLTEEQNGSVARESVSLLRERVGRPGEPLRTVWQAMVVDALGGVWLRRATCAGPWEPEEEGEWEVIGLGGAPRALVGVPSAMEILSVRGDRVLVATYDDLEVPHLAVHRVVR